MLFDTHAHLDDKQFAQDREEVIQRAKDGGVELIVNVGYNLASAKRTLALVEKYDFIYGSVGLHPHDAKDGDDRTLAELKRMAQHPKIVALGEMGLDYYWNHSPHEVQKEVFRKQIALAKELKLPIIIHDRDAHQDILNIVKEEGAKEVGGIFHCYSGSWPMAREVMKLGFYISLAGPVTFHNAQKPKEVVKEVPLDYLLIETDCPYLAPVPYRGRRNEPLYVAKVAEMIAEVKGIPVEKVAEATKENGKRVFRIK
ncbi:MAG: TatD family hydrolase [Bacillota bacterium]|uniref:YchF/TatD family DNA exonuclease n=1 Tax=Thermanaerosceptrum fracticalcis TaxID=1712410 RepID=A0A7G6E5C0_THEFR|nr:TatD family hydrolase [Thermanaerosceptrum fracticalcis]QNB47274.1 YchF/TatD family DNA exonuclease [Thermanaerosceptrum fracticalcis]